MKKRDQLVRLTSKSGKKVGDLPHTIDVKVVQHDSQAGYLAEIPASGDWKWFDPKIWKEVK